MHPRHKAIYPVKYGVYDVCGNSNGAKDEQTLKKGTDYNGCKTTHSKKNDWRKGTCLKQLKLYLSFERLRIMQRFLLNKYSTTLVCFLCLGICAFGQGAGYGIETNFMAGKIIKHTPKIKGPIPPLSTAFELSFVQQTDGRKDWQQRRHYPLLGFGIAVTNYGIDSIYGKCISIFPHMQVPIIRSKKLEWTFRAGFGIGYVTKRFSRAPEWDTLNTAIGSHLNNYTTFHTDLRYHINQHWDVQIGANFSHISNAGFRTPNLGLNMAGAHIGLRYFPVSSTPKRIKKSLPKLSNRWLAQARLGISANEYGMGDGPLYPIYIASLYASRRYAGKNKMFAGIDYSYHEGIYAFLRNNEIWTGAERAHSWKSSIFIGNEFLIGRVGLVLQVGVYIKQAALALDPYYEKLGGNFYLIQNEKGVLKDSLPPSY